MRLLHILKYTQVHLRQCFIIEANTMKPDHAAFMIKSRWNCTLICVTDVLSRQQFQDKLDKQDMMQIMLFNVLQLQFPEVEHLLSRFKL